MRQRKFQSHLFGESFPAYVEDEKIIDYRWNCLYYRAVKETTQNRGKICDSWNSTTFFRCLFFLREEIPFPLLVKRNIWIKSFHDGVPDRNLHTEGPLSNHNCAFQLHHVTELLNDSFPKLSLCFPTKKKKEISSLKLFKMMTVLRDRVSP